MIRGKIAFALTPSECVTQDVRAHHFQYCPILILVGRGKSQAMAGNLECPTHGMIVRMARKASYSALVLKVPRDTSVKF